MKKAKPVKDQPLEPVDPFDIMVMMVETMGATNRRYDSRSIVIGD